MKSQSSTTEVAAEQQASEGQVNTTVANIQGALALVHR